MRSSYCKKEKLPIKNDDGGGGLFHDPLGELNKEKALLLSQQGFFFVDKRFEISNFDIVRDLMKVVELLNE